MFLTLRVVLMVLFGLVGIAYFVSGMLFSRLWSRLSDMMDGEPTVMTSPEAFGAIERLGGRAGR